MFPIVASKLGKDLGYGMRLPTILSSAAFTVCLFFYIYFIGSFFTVAVYPLINRVTFDAIFEEHIVNEYVDSIIVIVATTSWFVLSVNNRVLRYCFSIIYGGAGAILVAISPDNVIFDILTLLSLPSIISILLYSYKRHKNILNFNVNLTLRYISLVIIAVSAIGIAFQVSSVFSDPPLDPSSTQDSHANELFLLLSSFSTIYIVLLVFCLPVKVLFKGALRTLKIDLKEDISQSQSHNYEVNGRGRLKTQTKVGFLLLAMFLSVVLVLLPHHPSINKDSQDIGVDTHYYVTWIGELAKSKSLSDFAYQAFIVQGQDGDRPLSLISLFLVYQVAGGNGNLSEVLEYSPIILGPSIVLAIYFLASELARNQKIALIAAFLGAVSLHTLAGIYAGYYANWLALIVGYMSIVFLFRYLRSGRLSDIAVFSTLLVGVLFFHVYTWTLLTAVAGIFLLAMLLIVIWKNKKNNRNNSNNNNHFTGRRITWLLVVILISIAVDVTKVSLTGSSGGLERDLELAETNLGIEQYNFRWFTLNVTMHHSLGGVFSNFVILILGLLWIVKANMREPGTVFLMIFLSAGLIPLFFASWEPQARVFYDMPFEIPAAIALYYISSRSCSMLVTLAACSWLAAVSSFTAMNFHLT